MRYGFTTGSCSAAAAKAATYMLLSGIPKHHIEIETPAGKMFNAEIVDIFMSEKVASCAVIKDGGDDPDITTGSHICVCAEYGSMDKDDICIEGGPGVGRVTRPGLDQPVGNAAINSVPRQMIVKEVCEVKDLLDFHGTIKITVSVPEGEELAGKTFNPRLGIEGGISILGTTGIVEPMSNQALLDTIKVELNQRRSLGFERVCISPGNYGLDFLKSSYDFDLDRAVKCSNFIGNTLDIATELGFKHILLVGHLGKLVKVAGGIMNTHSREADCRMEILTSLALLAMNDLGVEYDNHFLLQILSCVNTEEAIGLIGEKDNVLKGRVCEILMEKIYENLNRRVTNKSQVECMVYTNEQGIIGTTSGAVELLSKIREE